MKLSHVRCGIFAISLMAASIILPVQGICAEQTPSSESSSNSFQIEQMLKEKPDMVVDAMEKQFRVGSLSVAGHLAGKVLESMENEDARSILSIYLTSQGKIDEADRELKLARLNGKTSWLSLCADAMIRRARNDRSGAIEAAREASEMDSSQPYPLNILGRVYFDMGEHEKALAAFDKAVELEPGFTPGYVNLGALFYVMEKPEKAIEYFSKAIELDNSLDAPHLGLALIYRNLGNDGLAEKELKGALDINPENRDALRALSEVRLKVGNYEGALESGMRMEQLGMEEAPGVLGDAALHLGNVEGALKYLEKAPQDKVNTMYLVGYCFMVKGDHKKALQVMEKALAKDPKHFGACTARLALMTYLGEPRSSKDMEYQWEPALEQVYRFLVGDSYASKGEWRQAFENWSKAEGIIGGFSMAGIGEDMLGKCLKEEESRRIGLGVLYYYRGLIESARLELAKALALNPASFMSNYWMAQVHLKKAESADAAKCLEKAIAQAPDFFSGVYGLAELDLLMGKRDAAIGLYRRALAVKKDQGILIKLGLLFEDAKDYEEAEKQYRQLIELYPGFFVGYNQLAWLFASRGVNLDEAMELARKADELLPGNSSILDTIGWIYYQRKDYPAALEKLKLAHEARPSEPTILKHLETVYDALGDKAAAEECRTKLIEMEGQPRTESKKM